MLAMPRWEERARLPKLATVVIALATTARAVLVPRISGSPGAETRCRCTRWMPLSTPIPSRSGSTTTLAKLNGIASRTPAAVVMVAASKSGTITRSESWCLGHHQPVVSVNGRSGGYSLDRIIPCN